MLKSAIPLACIAVLLSATNPGEDTYAAWAVQELQTDACRKPRSAACMTVTSIPRDFLTSALKQYTRHQNCVFFGIYTTRILGFQKQSIGLGGFFVEFQAASAEEGSLP